MIAYKLVVLLALSNLSVFLLKAPIFVFFFFFSDEIFNFDSLFSSMFAYLIDSLIGLVTCGRGFFLKGFLSTDDIFFALIGSI